MRGIGRRIRVALIGLVGLLGALAPGAPAAGSADTYRTDTELSTKEMGAKEGALGDLVADAIRASARADVAFIPAADFANTLMTIKPGTFVIADLLKALEYKYENIALVKLTGDQIRAALEYGLYLYPQSNCNFLQTSGLTISVNPNGGSDHRIVAIKVDGDPLVNTKTYHVAMPRTLANGALAYSKYWKKSDLEKDTEKTLESAIGSYLTDHKSITKGDERLVANNK